VYHAVLEGMVEQRMRVAVHRLGSFWYTAWMVAGRPDLGLEAGPAEEEEPLQRDSLYYDPRCGEVGLGPQDLPDSFPRELLAIQENSMLVDASSQGLDHHGREQKDTHGENGFPERRRHSNQSNRHIVIRRFGLIRRLF